MTKKPDVRKFMGSEHVKGSKKLLKSARQYFYLILWWLWNNIGSKIFAWVVPEILRLFVNILTPNQSYSFSVKASV